MSLYEYDSSKKKILYRGERLSKADVLSHLNIMHESLERCSAAWGFILDAGSLMAPLFALDEIPVSDAEVADPDDDIRVGGTD